MLHRCSGSAQDARNSAKVRQGESTIMPRKGLSHPRVIQDVVRMPPDAENCDFPKIDVLRKKSLGFRRSRRPAFDPKWSPNAPKSTMNCQKLHQTVIFNSKVFQNQPCGASATLCEADVAQNCPQGFQRAPQASPRPPPRIPRQVPWSFDSLGP